MPKKRSFFERLTGSVHIEDEDEFNDIPPVISDKKEAVKTGSGKNKKEEWIDDYKMQLVAYILAHNEVYGTNIREGHVFMCSRDFQYQQFDLWPDEFTHWENQWLDKVQEYYTTGMQGLKQMLTG